MERWTRYRTGTWNLNPNNMYHSISKPFRESKFTGSCLKKQLHMFLAPPWMPALTSRAVAEALSCVQCCDILILKCIWIVWRRILAYLEYHEPGSVRQSVTHYVVHDCQTLDFTSHERNLPYLQTSARKCARHT